jgi:hypothetical protein
VVYRFKDWRIFRKQAFLNLRGILRQVVVQFIYLDFNEDRVDPLLIELTNFPTFKFVVKKTVSLLKYIYSKIFFTFFLQVPVKY